MVSSSPRTPALPLVDYDMAQEGQFKVTTHVDKKRRKKTDNEQSLWSVSYLHPFRCESSHAKAHQESMRHAATAATHSPPAIIAALSMCGLDNMIFVMTVVLLVTAVVLVVVRVATVALVVVGAAAVVLPMVGVGGLAIRQRQLLGVLHEILKHPCDRLLHVIAILQLHIGGQVRQMPG